MTTPSRPSYKVRCLRTSSGSAHCRNARSNPRLYSSSALLFIASPLSDWVRTPVDASCRALSATSCAPCAAAACNPAASTGSPGRSHSRHRTTLAINRTNWTISVAASDSSRGSVVVIAAFASRISRRRRQLVTSRPSRATSSEVAVENEALGPSRRDAAATLSLIATNSLRRPNRPAPISGPKIRRSTLYSELA